MSSRAIELLNLPDDQPSFILDVGFVTPVWFFGIFALFYHHSSNVFA
jgi:hypothetical protein